MDSILKAVVHLFLLLMPKTTTLTPWLNWTWQFHELTVPTLTLNVKCLFIKLMGFQMIPKWRHREIFTRKVEFRWKLLAFSLGKVLIQFCMVKFAVDLVLPSLKKLETFWEGHIVWRYLPLVFMFTPAVVSNQVGIFF